MKRLVSLTSVLLVAGVAFGAGDEKSSKAAASDREVACATSGVEVTVRLSYDPNRTDLVSAAYVDLGFGAPLALPADATPAELRSRMKTLTPPPTRVAPPVKRGAGVRVALTTSEPGISPQDLFTLRLDCPEGAKLGPRDFTCTTAEVGDRAGFPMVPELARQVGCAVVRVEPAAPTH